MSQKKYTNAEITVVWKPELCTHSTNCWKGLGAVFNPKARHWITMAGASSAEISAQVEQCPSGALSWYRNDAPPASAEEEIAPPSATVTPAAGASVEVLPNGPLLVRGGTQITHHDGSRPTRRRWHCVAAAARRSSRSAMARTPAWAFAMSRRRSQAASSERALVDKISW